MFESDLYLRNILWLDLEFISDLSLYHWFASRNMEIINVAVQTFFLPSFRINPGVVFGKRVLSLVKQKHASLLIFLYSFFTFKGTVDHTLRK